MEDVLRLPKSTSDLSKGVHRLFLRQSLSLETSGKIGGNKIFCKKNDAVTNGFYQRTFQGPTLQENIKGMGSFLEGGIPNFKHLLNTSISMYSFHEAFQRNISSYLLPMPLSYGHSWNNVKPQVLSVMFWKTTSFNGLHRHDLRQVHSALSRKIMFLAE